MKGESKQSGCAALSIARVASTTEPAPPPLSFFAEVNFVYFDDYARLPSFSPCLYGIARSLPSPPSTRRFSSGWCRWRPRSQPRCHNTSQDTRLLRRKSERFGVGLGRVCLLQTADFYALSCGNHILVARFALEDSRY